MPTRPAEFAIPPPSPQIYNRPSCRPTTTPNHQHPPPEVRITATPTDFHGVKHNTVVAVVEAEAFSRQEIYEALEHVASGIADGYACYVLWRIAPLEERVAQLVAVCIVLKADGVIPFAVKLIVTLHAVALCNLFRDATLCQITDQRRRLQPGYYYILEGRFLYKLDGFIRLCHRHIHLFGDMPCLLNKIGLARQYSCERKNVAAFARTEIVSIWEQPCLGSISANR